MCNPTRNRDNDRHDKWNETKQVFLVTNEVMCAWIVSNNINENGSPARHIIVVQI